MSDLVFRPGSQGRCVPGRRHSLCEGLVTQSLQLGKPEVVGCNQNGEWVLQEVGGLRGGEGGNNPSETLVVMAQAL